MLRRLTSAGLMILLIAAPALGYLSNPPNARSGHQGMSMPNGPTTGHACCPKLHSLVPLTLPGPAAPCGDQHRCCFLSGPDSSAALLAQTQAAPQLCRTGQSVTPQFLPFSSFTPGGRGRSEFRSYSDFSMIARN